MSCAHCQGIETIFGKRMAARELKEYRRRGPNKITRLLLATINQAQLQGMTLLDIGGGVGAIQHHLVEAGVEQVTNVDASTAYLAAAKAEAERLGYVDRAGYHFGDFVDLALTIEAADIVTLDRVLCCYPDMTALISASAGRAKRWYGLVYPRDTWWLKLFRPLFNSLFWLTRNPYRFFVHSTAAVEAAVQSQGLVRHFHKKTFFWQVVVYQRS